MTVLIIPSIDREIISWDELAKKSYRVIEYLQNLGTTPTFRYESTVNGFSVDDIDLVNIKSHQDLIKYIKEYN